MQISPFNLPPILHTPTRPLPPWAVIVIPLRYTHIVGRLMTIFNAVWAGPRDRPRDEFHRRAKTGGQLVGLN